MTARISIPAPVPMPVWSDAEVSTLLAISTPPSSPLSPCPICSLGYRAAMIRMKAEAASTSHSLPLPPPFILSPTRSDTPSSGIPPPLPISVPTSTPPLLLPSASRREDKPEVTLPPRKRLGIALGPRYKVEKSSYAATARPAGCLRAYYGFVATLATPVSTDTELGQHMIAFETRVRQDTDEIYTRLDDKQSQRQLLAGRLNIKWHQNKPQGQHRLQQSNGDDNHTLGTGVRGSERVARECTYQDFMKCKPLYFNGTEGVFELTQWFERMKTIFRISNCSVENQIKVFTCTLLAGALTWWNSYVLTVSHDVAYAMTWADLRKKMTDKYCPRNEMKKLEAELWNLKVKGIDVIGYN
ncbi:reverse transcriptase domain-containing protein [Tanacetum coccineum]